MLVLALFACDDGERFISLRDLCLTLADDVCEARASCCPSDPVACRAAEEQRCMAAASAYEGEASLRYDADEAARVRASSRGGLDRCETAPRLASFFQGGLAVGVTCERDAQCVTGRCGAEPRVCIDAPLEPLCPAP
jgi:hypothetical protein